MSGKNTFAVRPELPFARALDLARILVDDLAPVCERVKVVGSLRRQRASLTEIDLLVEPRALQMDMLGSDGPDLQPIRGVVGKWGKIEKNGDRYMKIRLEEPTGPAGFGVDLFLCHPPAEWGSLLAIRTGPAELATRAVSLMASRGLRHEAGRVIETSTGKTISTPDEETFFALAGLPMYTPGKRDSYESRIPLSEPASLEQFTRADSWSPSGPVAHARNTDPATSHEAAAKVGSSLESMVDVLRCLEALGSGHDEAIVEVAPSLGIARTDSRIRTARSDAARRGWITDTGTVAKTAAGGNSRVWQLNNAGRAMLAISRDRGTT